MKKCVQCGNDKFSETTEKHEVRVGDRVVVGTLPAKRCTSCKEVYVDASDVGRLEQAVAAELVARGIVDGPSFRHIRRAMGLQSKELAEMLGTTPETITRWEKGTREVDRFAWITLAILFTEHGAKGPARRIVNAARAPGELPKTIKVA